MENASVGGMKGVSTFPFLSFLRGSSFFATITHTVRYSVVFAQVKQVLSRGEYDNYYKDCTGSAGACLSVCSSLRVRLMTLLHQTIDHVRTLTDTAPYSTPPPSSSSSSWLENTHYQNDNQTFTYSMPRLTLPPPPPPRQKKKKQKKKEKSKTQTPPEIPDFHG